MEFPHFQEVWDEHKGQFALVSITDDSSTDPKGFVADMKLNWLFGVAQEAPNLYGLQGWPTTYFIDRTGKIVDTQVGAMDKDEFESKLKQIL